MTLEGISPFGVLISLTSIALWCWTISLMSGTVLFLYFLISAHKIGSSPLSKVLGGNPLCFSPPLPSSQVERKKNVSDWQVRGIPRAIGPGPLLGKVTSGLWLPPLSSLLGACSLAPCSPRHCLSSWGSSLAAQAVSDGKHNSQQVEQEDYLVLVPGGSPPSSITLGAPDICILLRILCISNEFRTSRGDR